MEDLPSVAVCQTSQQLKQEYLERTEEEVGLVWFFLHFTFIMFKMLSKTN